MNDAIFKDLLVPIISTFAVMSFAGAATVAWWGIRRLVSGQDQINVTLTHISEQLSEAKQEVAVAKERVASLERREEKRERHMDELHKENSRAFEQVWREIRALGANHD